MMRTTPFRLISLHLSQMRLMLDRTFMTAPAVKDDTAWGRRVNENSIAAGGTGNPTRPKMGPPTDSGGSW